MRVRVWACVPGCAESWILRIEANAWCASIPKAFGPGLTGLVTTFATKTRKAVHRHCTVLGAVKTILNDIVDNTAQ